MVSFLKISENHEKFVEKVDFYSSISLSGSGFRMWIRIQPGNLNPDPTGSGSETLPGVHRCFFTYPPPGAHGGFEARHRTARGSLPDY